MYNIYTFWFSVEMLIKQKHQLWSCKAGDYSFTYATAKWDSI